MLFIHVKCRSIPTIIQYRTYFRTMRGIKNLLTRIRSQVLRNPFHSPASITDDHLRSCKAFPRFKHQRLIPKVNSSCYLKLSARILFKIHTPVTAILEATKPHLSTSFHLFTFRTNRKERGTERPEIFHLKSFHSLSQFCNIRLIFISPYTRQMCQLIGILRKKECSGLCILYFDHILFTGIFYFHPLLQQVVFG